MAQNDLVKVGGALVIGAVIAVAAVSVAFDLTWPWEKETDVTLSVPMGGSGCVLGKETAVRVKRNRTLVWKIRNYCTDGAKMVIVGNVRTTSAPPAGDCSAATSGTVDYPFTEQGLSERSQAVEAGEKKSNGSIDPGDAKLRLKVRNLNIPDNDPSVTYYYDICLGDQKSDPRLEVER
jgi:hypothetical protein